MERELMQAAEDYIGLFGQEPLIPFGVSDTRAAAVLREAVRQGEPVSEDFNWYSDLPKNADV